MSAARDRAFRLRRLAPAPAMAGEADRDALRDAGRFEEEILETARIVAIFNVFDRLDAGLGVKIDGGSRDAFRGA